MALIDALLPEFDHEMTLTRRVLERVPEDKLSWGPHAKSMTLGGLATHLSRLPIWAELTMSRSDFDVAANPPPVAATSRAEILAGFDDNVARARAVLTGRTDAELLAPWTLKRGKDTVFTMPKTRVLRSMVLNHIVHHRGQLTVYLRLQDVPLPSIYGPSADESAA